MDGYLTRLDLEVPLTILEMPSLTNYPLANMSRIVRYSSTGFKPRIT